MPGHGDAVFEGDAADGDEGNDIGRPHARVRALMPREVDELGGLARAANGSFLDGFALAYQGDDAAVVIGVHLAVEEIDAGNEHGFDDGIDLGWVAAFGEIGNTFNECGGHESRIKRVRAIGQT